MILLAFAGTVCMMVLMTGLSWAIRGPASVPDSARDYMKDIIFLMAGGVITKLGGTLTSHKDEQPK